MITLKQFTLFLISILFSSYAIAQSINLTEKAEISILTIGPGNYLYDKFGHSAIRVRDKNIGIDMVFNYGTYDFNTPNFYSKFARGKLLYSLSLSDFTDFFQYYRKEDRWITEQLLNLNNNQKKAVFQLLMENAKPENREYLYDFTYDNCATRIRDILSLALEDKIDFPTTPTNTSFRDLIQENLHSNTWGSIGIQLALGASMDRHISRLEQQFLPNYVLKANTETHIKNNNKGWFPLVKETNYLNKQKKSKKSSFSITSPWVIFSILGALLFISVWRDKRNENRTKYVDITIFTITGVIGLILVFLWFGTDHQATKFNYNILWAFPLNIFFIKTISSNNYNKRIIQFINLLRILLFLMFFHWVTGVQKFPIPILPLLIGLLIRYNYLVNFYTKKSDKTSINTYL